MEGEPNSGLRDEGVGDAGSRGILLGVPTRLLGEGVPVVWAAEDLRVARLRLVRRLTSTLASSSGCDWTAIWSKGVLETREGTTKARRSGKGRRSVTSFVRVACASGVQMVMSSPSASRMENTRIGPCSRSR